MFGSLRVDSRLLTADQRASYRAHFCAACHAMRELGGRGCSLLTSYDVNVLALVVSGLSGSAVIERRPCTALPLRRVRVARIPERAGRFLAAANLAVVGAKLRDDVDDDGRLLARLGLSVLRRREERALAELRAVGFPIALVRDLPRRQRRVEADRGASLDALAGPSARLVGAVFGHAGVVCGQPETAAALERFGGALGRFVYLWDAVEDLREDLRRRRFNALAHAFGANPDLLVADPRARRAVHTALGLALADAEAALGGIDLGPSGVLLGHLLGSLRRKIERRVGSVRCLAADRPREAGDCDCACDACSCDACGCCGDSADAAGGDCACCAAPCEVCCCFGEQREARRRKRRDRGEPRHPTL